jgi:hypothetical protein
MGKLNEPPFFKIQIKGKAIPVQALRAAKISRQSAQESGKVSSPTQRPPLPSGKSS